MDNRSTQARRGTMFKVRSEQLRALQDDAEAAFVARVAAYLRTRHPATAVRLRAGTVPVSRLPDELLRQLIAGGLARARSYGITARSTLNAYVVVMFVAAPNFDQHPSVRRVLTDPSVLPDWRIESLFEQLPDATWQDVRRRYDVNAWAAAARRGH